MVFTEKMCLDLRSNGAHHAAQDFDLDANSQLRHIGSSPTN